MSREQLGLTASLHIKPFNRANHRMARVSYRHAFLFGSLATTIWLVWEMGWPPLDLFFILLFGTIVACGGIFMGAILLAWRHVRHDPRLLRSTAAALVLLSVPPLACYQTEKRLTPWFMASADSVHGEIMGRNVLGNLLIRFPVDSGRLARMVAPKKHAHQRFEAGDSIWVYRKRLPPRRVDVWPPGPDLRVLANRLFWFWVVGGVLLAGYAPIVRREYGSSRRSVNANADARGRSTL